MVVSRYGSNPEKFVYESDELHSLRVSKAQNIFMLIKYRALKVLELFGPIEVYRAAGIIQSREDYKLAIVLKWYLSN